MSVLISGSFAFDTIMVFGDRFANHILPKQTHMLNVSFYVPQMRKEFGGCAGNIAYNLKLLGGAPLPMGTVGGDFAAYRAWLARHEIDDAHVREIADTFTAQAFVTTDADNNQITAFHPGAMDYAHQNQVANIVKTAANIKLGIVAPNGREAMLQHAAQFSAAGIPFMFDPGQGLPMFDGDDLAQFIAQATWLAVNAYESELLQQKTAQSLKQIAAQVDALIVTRGAQGADIYADKLIHVDAAKISNAVDPTGCGDAFRGGLLYGLAQKLDWQTCAQIASTMGAIKIESAGTQNHRFTKAEFEKRYRESFGQAIKIGLGLA